MALFCVLSVFALIVTSLLFKNGVYKAYKSSTSCHWMPSRNSVNPFCISSPGRAIKVVPGASWAQGGAFKLGLAIHRWKRTIALKELIMKRILLLLVLGFVGVAAGQDTIAFTNKVVTFTNLQGRAFRDVRLVRADLDGIIYQEGATSGGRVYYTNLPVAFLESLGISSNRITAAKARADRQAVTDAAYRQRFQQQAQQKAAAADSYSGPPQEGTRGTHALRINFKSDPLREYRGRVYDFSEAIKWHENAPPPSSPYPAGSPLYAEWEGRKNAYEASQWKRYLLEGSLLETRPEGLVFAVPIKTQVESYDSIHVAGGRLFIPRYTTIDTFKHVLLEHAPEGSVRLPIFAIPAGTTSLPGGVLIEAFDYGKPINK